MVQPKVINRRRTINTFDESPEICHLRWIL